MSHEILIDHATIQDPQTITKVMEDKFKEHDLDLHRHEVEVIDDDDKKGIRKLRVKNTKYFAIGNVPWHRPSSEDRSEQSPSLETVGKGDVNE